MLLLNKTDLFAKKIKNSSCCTYWPHFPGPGGDYDAAMKLFTEKFPAQQSAEDSRHIFLHFTSAANMYTFPETLKRIEDVIKLRLAVTEIHLRR